MAESLADRRLFLGDQQRIRTLVRGHGGSGAHWNSETVTRRILCLSTFYLLR